MNPWLLAALAAGAWYLYGGKRRNPEEHEDLEDEVEDLVELSDAHALVSVADDIADISAELREAVKRLEERVEDLADEAEADARD